MKTGEGGKTEGGKTRHSDGAMNKPNPLRRLKLMVDEGLRMTAREENDAASDRILGGTETMGPDLVRAAGWNSISARRRIAALHSHGVKEQNADMEGEQI